MAPHVADYNQTPGLYPFKDLPTGNAYAQKRAAFALRALVEQTLDGKSIGRLLPRDYLLLAYVKANSEIARCIHFEMLCGRFDALATDFRPGKEARQ